MKKYINLKHLIFGALLIMAVSCDSADQDVKPITSTADYPVATFVIGNTEADEEGGDIVEITVNLDKMITAGISFDAEVIGGTAVLGEDFDILSTQVSAFSTQAIIQVVIYEDIEPESVETIELQLVAPALNNKFLLNPTTVFPTVSITIDNYLSNAIDMSFDWETGIDFGGTTYGACANIDLDIFVSDAAGFDINDPWATFNGTNYAATGDCPEEFAMDMTAWGDGEYIIWHENWTNGFAGLGTNTLVPITATIVRAGSFSATVVQKNSEALNSDNGGEDDAVPFNTHGAICKVTIANGIFTISDIDGNQVGLGRHSSQVVKTPRPEELRK